MEDKYPHMSELKPMWRRVSMYPPPKGVKLLFKGKNSQLVTGVWYDESRWDYWCPMPSHTPEDKAWNKEQDASPSGRFTDGKPVGYES